VIATLCAAASARAFILALGTADVWLLAWLAGAAGLLLVTMTVRAAPAATTASAPALPAPAHRPS
jgi:hypothetical protein